MHLWQHFYLERPVFDSEQLESLHSLIINSLPRWSTKLKVLENEDKRNGKDVTDASELVSAINQEAHIRRGRGSAVLKGAYDGLTIFLDTCPSTFPPELNIISVEIEQPIIEEETTPQWASRFFEAMANQLPLRYANAYVTEEFDAKNMVSDDEGVRAIGVHLDESLPGLYWLNFFGSPYIKLIGRDCLLSVPTYAVREISNGVFVSLNSSPTEWASDIYEITEESIKEHIGCQYVFSRTEPDRKTIAPVFRGATQ